MDAKQQSDAERSTSYRNPWGRRLLSFAILQEALGEIKEEDHVQQVQTDIRQVVTERVQAPDGVIYRV